MALKSRRIRLYGFVLIRVRTATHTGRRIGFFEIHHKQGKNRRKDVQG
jgi:hypothetical protein